ncbi:hypothetical protein GF342_05260 [Candidatus Woesearchaeota archaeon]|nr:hypothetical protein [Candidatus Woesearchaeota archaeon]
METQTPQTEQPKQPMKKIRVGALCATIWNNESNGRSWPSIVLERSYKDAKGDWKQTTSLRQTDLANASLVLNEALRFLAIEQA